MRLRICAVALAIPLLAGQAVASPASARFVKDIVPGAGGAGLAQLTLVGGILYFTAWRHASGTELWRSDGTRAGTVLDKDIAPGPTAGATALRAHDALRRTDCTITGTNDADRLVGTDGPDVICARGGKDEVRGHGGDDVLFLGPGRDTFTAGAGDDRVFGGLGDDYYGDGGRGDDRIYLQAGDDLVEDYVGADLLSGGSGRDWLCNGDGKANDRLIGGPGHDHAAADDGDTISSVEDEGPCFY